ncbi:hypothetical protein F5B21DRAFT_460164 [Xylaria acuta]|nr:hypothetical protein F5B21DRAFT_460164 [Xylaria acuta]
MPLVKIISIDLILHSPQELVRTDLVFLSLRRHYLTPSNIPVIQFVPNKPLIPSLRNWPLATNHQKFTMTTSLPYLHFSSFHVSPMGLARGTTSLLAILGLTMGTRSILYPGAFCDTFFGRAPAKKSVTAKGAKSRKAEEEDPNPWIILLGGRTITSGIGMLGCAALGLDRALGVCLCASIVAAGVDGWVVMRYGPKLLLGDGENVSAAERKEVEELTFQTGLGHWCFLGAFSIMGAWMAYAAEK